MSHQNNQMGRPSVGMGDLREQKSDLMKCMSNRRAPGGRRDSVPVGQRCAIRPWVPTHSTSSGPTSSVQQAVVAGFGSGALSRRWLPEPAAFLPAWSPGPRAAMSLGSNRGEQRLLGWTTRASDCGITKELKLQWPLPVRRAPGRELLRGRRSLRPNRHCRQNPAGKLQSSEEIAETDGSRGRTRTYNHTVNSRVLYH